MRRYIDDYIAPAKKYFMPKSTVLDVGCGHGYLTVDIAAHAGRVVGIDINKKRLDTAQEFTKAEGSIVEYIHADSRKLPFADNTFDVVFSQWMLEWMADPEKAIAEMHRVARPGGVVIVHIGWWPGISFDPPCPTIEHIHQRCAFLSVPNMIMPVELLAMLKEAGLIDSLVIHNPSPISSIYPSSGEHYVEELRRLSLMIDTRKLVDPAQIVGKLHSARLITEADVIQAALELSEWEDNKGSVNKTFLLGIGVKP